MEKNHRSLHGCFIATLTPFDQRDQLDEGVVREHAMWLIEQGVEGLCPAGTTGEFLYLSQEEKRRIITATVAAAEGRVPVLAGVWALRPSERTELTRSALDSGASGVFLPPPIYYPADDDVIERYYEEVSLASDLPVYAYHIPQYAANAISVECLERLISRGIIAGVKDSTGSTQRMEELITRFSGRATLFAASDSFATQGRALGAQGFISAIGNLMPSVFVRLWHGDSTLQPLVDHIRAALKQAGSIPGLKVLLARKGFPFGASRLPEAARHEEQMSRLLASWSATVNE